jgi:hypothetical protein
MEVGDKFDGLIDELVKSGKTLDELLSEGGELRQLYKRLAERTLEAEMAAHLGYEPHAASGRGTGNSRNGKSKKTLVGDHGSRCHAIAPAASSRSSFVSTSAGPKALMNASLACMRAA